MMGVSPSELSALALNGTRSMVSFIRTQRRGAQSVKRIFSRHTFVAAAFAVCLALPIPSHAQLGGGGGIGGGGGGGIGGGGGNGGGGGGGIGGGGNGVVGGVAIDPSGLLSVVDAPAVNAKLKKKKLQALAEKHLESSVSQPSTLRKVSLVKLENECRKWAASGEALPPEIEFLAGLQRIDYMFVDETGKDLVIAGPAGAFAPDENGRIVSVETNRPPLRLDDLIVILRAVRSEGIIGCSIDPEPSRMARMQEYIRTNSTPASVSVAQGRYRTMAEILGLQKVSIWGVPHESHAAQVLVEADYRMKLVTIGRLRPPVRGFISHLAMMRPGGNSMRRWWFTPLYDSIQQTEDGDAFHLQGPRAQLLSQEEYADSSGNRFDSSKKQISSEKYGKQFTQRFEELANAVPAFAELQNLMDLIVVSTLIQSSGLADRVDWKADLFMDEKSVNLATRTVPTHVRSAFNYKMSGRRLVLGLIGGGVQIQPRRIVRANLETSTDNELESARDNYGTSVPSDSDQWWWD